MNDNDLEMLPHVNETGETIGSVPRGKCHNGSMILHPVVHLHVFNAYGELFLQHRPAWKKIQPNRWDTAVGGHIAFGETVETALLREVLEEIGLTHFVPEFLTKYIHTSEIERELVYVYSTVTTLTPRPSAELDGGRFFTRQEIIERLGGDFFSPNFEAEWKKLFL